MLGSQHLPENVPGVAGGEAGAVGGAVGRHGGVGIDDERKRRACVMGGVRDKSTELRGAELRGGGGPWMCFRPSVTWSAYVPVTVAVYVAP